MIERSDARESNPLRDLRGALVLIAHPPDADGQLIARELQRIHCEVQLIWPAPAAPPEGAGAVFVLIEPRQISADSFLTDAPARAPIIGIVAQDNSAGLRGVEASTLHAVLTKPATRQAILTNLILARNNFRYERRLQTKVSRLEETLRVFRKVEQAKLILMRQRTIGENEAYDYLRRQAMNKRVSVAAIATAIVEANSLLK
jgi:two-component system, response regulator PdtaR